MNLKELDSFKISDAVHFHDELNPAIFDGDYMRPTVRDRLMLIAADFLEHLGITDIDVEDITISGSSAAYSYTKHSDIDLHILVDMDKFNNDPVYRELFDAKKVIYNDEHDIIINGYEVELYVQDTNQPVISLGEYSVMNNRWIKLPKKRKANFDELSSKMKYQKFYKLAEFALRSKNVDSIQRILKKLKKYRQSGLDEHGEFGPENIAYKALRSKGVIDKLYAKMEELHSQKLSLPENKRSPEIVKKDSLADRLQDELNKFKTDEDYDPNGKPPGPEFKPTMPAGTVRVDVSDVYDWYKLGQHISDIGGLGKHDFGKGPPSTIFSFGSEDEEHKYIKSLEKTGLTTTDIDPVDLNQPKGMKRQKTDPTYNVSEGASGYIPSDAEKDDPRFKTGLSVDVGPDAIKKNAKAFGFKVSRAGIPPLLRK